MSQADKPEPAPRRTLPAPMGIAPRPEIAIQAECDRLRVENTQLLARVSARESRNAELKAQVARLEIELAALREVEAPPPSLPEPSRVPIDLAPASSTNVLYAPGAVPSGAPREAHPSPGMGLDFGTVSRLSPDELDTLPYGLICLDALGRVVHYNDTEARMARLPKERVIGKNFFTDVAPCTRVREFEGEFYELVRDAGKIRVRSFDFVFRFKHSEQHVTIVLTPARQRGLFNMALLRRSVEARGAG